MYILGLQMVNRRQVYVRDADFDTKLIVTFNSETEFWEKFGARNIKNWIWPWLLAGINFSHRQNGFNHKLGPSRVKSGCFDVICLSCVAVDSATDSEFSPRKYTKYYNIRFKTWSAGLKNC